MAIIDDDDQEYRARDILRQRLSCGGEYLECKFDEIRDEDVDLVSTKNLSSAVSFEDSQGKTNSEDTEAVKPKQHKPERARIMHVYKSYDDAAGLDEQINLNTKPTRRTPSTAAADEQQVPVQKRRQNTASTSKWQQFAGATELSQTDCTQEEQPSTSGSQLYCVNNKRRRESRDEDDDAADNQMASAAAQNITNKPVTDFTTARQQLAISERKRNERTTATTSAPEAASSSSSTSTLGRKSLGVRQGAQNKFVSPLLQDNEPPQQQQQQQPAVDEPPIDERLKHIDAKMVELIRSEIMAPSGGRPIGWHDIAGLQYAKTTIREAVVWPMLRPDIFTGLRRPPRGILLFGPPGTGKTLIGKCIAAQSQSTFFSISASSLTSKWIGDGEKMVRALFAVAAVHQPAVIFIDEIDSLLSQRSDTEHESSRRLKTEFLVQLDGAATADDERLLIVGATNRPQELDEAARRRLVKRLYVPLPDAPARRQILDNLMGAERCSLSAAETDAVAQATEGFSGADMKVLCHEASMGPIRSIGSESQMEAIRVEAVRPVAYGDFAAALQRVRSSVSPADLEQYARWDATYGSGAAGV